MLKLIRQYRKTAYNSARLLGDYLPWLELWLGEPKAVRKIVRRQVNKKVGGAMGKFMFSGRGGAGGMLRKFLGL